MKHTLYYSCVGIQENFPQFIIILVMVVGWEWLKAVYVKSDMRKKKEQTLYHVHRITLLLVSTIYSFKSVRHFWTSPVPWQTFYLTNVLKRANTHSLMTIRVTIKLGIQMRIKWQWLFISIVHHSNSAKFGWIYAKHLILAQSVYRIFRSMDLKSRAYCQTDFQCITNQKPC